jgi:aquaporin Z
MCIDKPHPLDLYSYLLCCRPISGAHFNPAVSLAFAMRGEMSISEMITYWAAQLIGGIIGGLCGGIVASSYATVSVGVGATLTQALLAEVVFTFILCFVALCVATNTKVENNNYYGLAIGLVVLSGAISVGGISGGAFNPAVALGLSITSGMSKLFYALLVSVANLLGGIMAVACFRVVLPSEFEAGGTVGETAPLRGNP